LHNEVNSLKRPSIKSTISRRSCKKKWLLEKVLLLCIIGTAYSLPTISYAQDIYVSSKAQTQQVTLPNPLTLNALLDSFSSQSPSIAIQKARISLVEANSNANQVDNQWQANVTGRLGFREFAKETQDHHQLALHVGKVIYDFNRSANQEKADDGLISKQKIMLSEVENKQRLDVVQAFFNVLLSDFQYRIDNEAMAVEYVGFDKVKDKHAIGQLSDVDLLAAEQAYQTALVKRMQAEQNQLQTRIQLANVIGLPDARPDELQFPKLKALKSRSIKKVTLENLQQQVIEKNKQIKAIQQQLQSQLFILQAAKDSTSPTLRADAWLGQLSSHPEVREGSWKAALSIDVPLYDGGATSSATSKAQATINKLNAERQQMEQVLRTQVTDIYFQLKLLAAEKKQHQIFGDYADLYLDYSRALYENESSTDLGDAMVRLSEANYKMVAWEFKQALLWLQLDYLMGKTVSLTSSEVTTKVATAQNTKTEK
jgi:outer membrane protein TolC